LNELATLWIETFEWPHLPLYLHVVVCHLVDLQRRFPDLKSLSQQGVEHHHKEQKKSERTAPFNNVIGHGVVKSYSRKKALVDGHRGRIMDMKTYRSKKYKDFRLH